MQVKTAAVICGLILACIAQVFASATQDGAVIRNTGSTNFSGYSIKVRSDGSTSAVHTNRIGTPIDAPQTGHVDPRLAQTFLRDAQQARKNRLPAPQHCMKSASFGTTTVVLYHGWTSPDLECPANDGFTVALAADAHKIAAALKLQGLPAAHSLQRMLPNEPRRPEPTPSAS
jgi:hypothetical protein